MEIQKFVIKGRLESLNAYINACRRNVYYANNMKKASQKLISTYLKADKIQKVHKYPIKLKIDYYEPNSKRDVDGIFSYGCKVILDTLVNQEIIVDDSQKYLTGIENNVYLDKINPRIEVLIIENENI